MREDCHLCRAEGFSALTQVGISIGNRSIIAALNVVTEADWLPAETAALSDAAWNLLGASSGAMAVFSHPEPPVSASAIRAKVNGGRIDRKSDGEGKSGSVGVGLGGRRYNKK